VWITSSSDYHFPRYQQTAQRRAGVLVGQRPRNPNQQWFYFCSLSLNFGYWSCAEHVRQGVGLKTSPLLPACPGVASAPMRPLRNKEAWRARTLGRPCGSRTRITNRWTVRLREVIGVDHMQKILAEILVAVLMRATG
jgi:hypothetical protein